MPVAAAAVVTPPIWALISLDPAATDWMLRAISRVASPCWSIAVEMPAVISLIWAMVSVMPPIEATASLVEACIAATWAEISSVAFAVWLASALTSEATTAKPRPDSPARAASMVALSASRLVWAAIEWISLTTSPIFSAPVESACTVALVRSASPTALLAISLERATWREISATELDSSSAAAATVPTLFEALSRSRADGGGARAGVAGGRRHRLRGGLHAGRGRRHRADDAVDAALEVAGDVFHRRAAFRRGARLGLGLGLFEPADPHRIVLEDLDGRRHRADLVAAADAGNFAVELAVGQRLHAVAEQAERLG